MRGLSQKTLLKVLRLDINPHCLDQQCTIATSPPDSAPTNSYLSHNIFVLVDAVQPKTKAKEETADEPD